MSDIIRRAAANLVHSESFLKTFTELFTLEIERQLRHEAGGDTLYIAKTSDSFEKESRDARIKLQFTGANLDALSKEFKLSQRQIRRICKK